LLPSFLLLPFEIRQQIYDYGLSDLDALDQQPAISPPSCQKSRFYRTLKGYSAIILVNRQVHWKILDAFCFRTWTIFIKWEGLWFLGRRYCNTDECNEHQIDAALFDHRSGFPISFPFHPMEQLRV